MDSHNCGGELIPGVVMLKRSYQVDGFRCSHCGEEIVGRDTALSIEKLEREMTATIAADLAPYLAAYDDWHRKDSAVTVFPGPDRIDD